MLRIYFFLSRLFSLYKSCNRNKYCSIPMKPKEFHRNQTAMANSFSNPTIKQVHFLCLEILCFECALLSYLCFVILCFVCVFLSKKAFFPIPVNRKGSYQVCIQTLQDPNQETCSQIRTRQAKGDIQCPHVRIILLVMLKSHLRVFSFTATQL
jgi:hypothetical protein